MALDEKALDCAARAVLSHLAQDRFMYVDDDDGTLKSVTIDGDVDLIALTRIAVERYLSTTEPEVQK